ncbi:hypothetical protein Hanom_Chr12g01088631 [Helianthus anomalus]
MFVFLPHWSRVVRRFFVLLSLVPLDRSVGFYQFFVSNEFCSQDYFLNVCDVSLVFFSCAIIVVWYRSFCLRLYVDGLLVRVKWMIVVMDHLWQLGGFLKGLSETTLVNFCSGVHLTVSLCLFDRTAKMVKTVIREEIRLTSVEDRLSKSSPPARGFVFDLVPTPENQLLGLLRVKRILIRRKGDRNRNRILCRVSRMLLGSMKVVGIYIWVNESLFKNSTLVLCQTVKGVADATPIRDSNWDERLLIHISYSARRWTCKNCSLSSNITSSSLCPCDFKMFPIFRKNASSSGSFAGIVRDIISGHAEELKGAKALIDGNLVDVDEQYASDGCCWILVFTGSICSFAYSNSKEPISQDLADIKGDIISSLYSRFDVICDEADGQMDSVADGNGESVNGVLNQDLIPQLQLQLSRNRCSLSFPQRVFVPWLGDTYICDYIQSS